MACGLGAVILILILVRFEEGPSIPQEDQMKADLARLQAAQQNIQDEIARIRANNQTIPQTLADAGPELTGLEKQITALNAEIARQEAAIATLKKITQQKITQQNTPPAETSDVIAIKRKGEEEYLIGLSVTGKRIAILLDTSASMTNERLVDIIRVKGAGEATRRNQPKWQRGLAALEWLLARLPDNSQVTAVGFAQTARPLGAGDWIGAEDAQGLQTVLADARAITPQGATNLEAGLQAIDTLAPTDLYIITDGLPTKGLANFRQMSRFGDCKALWGKANTISGLCRQRLFVHSVKALAAPITVNIVLLPLEGDAGAMHYFWTWTSGTGGILISPATGWP